HFTLNEGVKDGDYEVTLQVGKNTVTYINGNTLGTKSALVGGVRIKVRGNMPETVITQAEAESQEALNTQLIIAICASSVLILAIIIFLLIKIKGKKS
ncbi:MAG: hypothetical protein J6Z36_01345, partial [Clostridia bacterium]|nr:hypothetical protein [Clostridia bacterium]